MAKGQPTGVWTGVTKTSMIKLITLRDFPNR
jgi:hypothetical protein